MNTDDRYLLPSRARREALTRRMNATMRDVYGGLEAQMFGVDPDARVQHLRESVGAASPRMVGLRAALESSEQ